MGRLLAQYPNALKSAQTRRTGVVFFALEDTKEVWYNGNPPERLSYRL
jgi:hypothetical protein